MIQEDIDDMVESAFSLFDIYIMAEEYIHFELVLLLCILKSLPRMQNKLRNFMVMDLLYACKNLNNFMQMSYVQWKQH